MSIIRWTPTNSECEFLLNENGTLLEVIKKDPIYANVSDDECFSIEMAKEQQLAITVQEAESLMQEILEEPIQE